MCAEGRVSPLVLLDGDDISMRVKEDRREGRVRARPLEENKWLAIDELNGLRFKTDGFGLGNEEIGCFLISGAGLGGVNLEVLLES